MALDSGQEKPWWYSQRITVSIIGFSAGKKIAENATKDAMRLGEASKRNQAPEPRIMDSNFIMPHVYVKHPAEKIGYNQVWVNHEEAGEHYDFSRMKYVDGWRTELFFVLYDADDPESYENAKKLIEDDSNNQFPKVLVRYKTSSSSADASTSSLQDDGESFAAQKGIPFYSVTEEEFIENVFAPEVHNTFQKIPAPNTFQVSPAYGQWFFRPINNHRYRTVGLFTLGGAAIPVLIYAGFLALKALSAISSDTSQRVIFHSINVPTSVGIGGGAGFMFGLLMVALAYGATHKPSPSTTPGAMPIQASD